MELFEHCRGCARYLRSCSGMSKEVCEQHNLRVPIINADCIRSMSVEEMAEAFANACPEDDTVNRCCQYSAKGGRGCYDCWLDWLRQEVDDEN